ncbi:putative baseplate assembly protein [Micromonospora endophytica]|uniref:putative baseplate assembly protein n=1 Tax=Micromonospora endophytica TaxID=515350 RepID=UPI001BB30B69|nr:putative baseplate assembly protein [Micromonospora endophytica]BCJ57208.1 putative baseplate assembly protein [Micromonospora endophytica]
MGYRLRPGLAAGATLACTVASQDGQPERVTIAAGTAVRSVPGPGGQPLPFETTEDLDAHPAWNLLPITSPGPASLPAGTVRFRLAGPATIRAGEPLLIVGGGPQHRYVCLVTRVADQVVDLQRPLSTMDISEPVALRLPARLRLYGHDAPPPASGELAALRAQYGQTWVDLDRVSGDAAVGRWLVLSGEPGTGVWPISGVDTVTRSDAGRTARVSRVRLGVSTATLADFLGARTRSTEVLLSGEALPLPGAPITGARLTLAAPVPPLPAGRLLVLRGGDDGETAVVAGMPDSGTLVLTAPLRGRYEPATLQVYGNVVLATHGETVDEVLGDGDATANARFTLARAPLTALPAPTGDGSAPALVVSVDAVPWQRIDDLADAGSTDEVYVLRRTGDGGVEVVFGDGTHGARPGNGVNNITARYRCGIGAAGNVPAGALTLLQNRPPGLRAVTNPLPATGGTDPQTGIAARPHLSGPVTAADRLVSAADVDRFVRAFAGIAAARMAVLAAAGQPLLHITVVGAGGLPVPAGSVLHTSLSRAIAQRRAPGPPMHIGSYRPVPVTIDARVRVDPRHAAAAVRADAEAVLRNAFAPGRRELARDVHRGELVALLHGVPGVVAVDPTGLPPHTVTCAPARWAHGAVQPAQLPVLAAVNVSTVEA